MRLLLALALLLAACSPRPSRPFPSGVAGPLSGRLRSEVLRLGFDAAEIPPAGASVERAGDAQDHTLPAARLRFLSARAAHGDAAGFFLLPPRLPEGLDWADYPEEWQAAIRVLKEIQALRPIIERGGAAEVPFPVPAGALSRAWSRGGRVYVLLINPSANPLPLDGDALAVHRALFRPRADAREALPRCGTGYCLPSGEVLWLEGRPLAGTAR